LFSFWFSLLSRVKNSKVLTRYYSRPSLWPIANIHNGRHPTRAVIGYQKLINRFLTSTLSDYMITIFQDRHSGMDCRNPGSMSLPSMALDTRFPAGMTSLCINLTK
jgi:hypothetical protein